MATVIQVDASRPDAGAVAIAADVIKRGGLVAFPTETVYGLGANALSSDAVRRVFEVKGRPPTDPLIVHVLDVRGLVRVASSVPVEALELAEAFWPGPLTVVVPRGENVPPEVTAGLDSVAVRSPDHTVARALIAAAGCPIAAPSANPFGRTSPTSAQHVETDLGNHVDLILDAGPTAVGIESTVVDCRVPPPLVLRLGGVTLEELAPWGARRMDSEVSSSDDAQTSPGTLGRHYAPLAKLVLLVGADTDVLVTMIAASSALTAAGLRVGLLVADEDARELEPVGVSAVGSLGSATDPAAVARNLYSTLREVDGLSDVILARNFGGAGLALSVNDRLTRAADGRVVLVLPGESSRAVASIEKLLA